MTLLSIGTRINYLRALGFRGSESTMTRNFQRGWNLGSALSVDGAYGPATENALKVSYGNLRANRPTASPHFSFNEFVCKCYGRYSACQGIWIARVHLQRLEAYRTHVGSVTIVSGCRCYGHNRAVGGASSSQHQFGVASDVRAAVSVNTMKGYRLFAGIGYQQSTGKVLHVDSRDIGGHNLTAGYPTRPTTWRYA